MPRMKRAVLVAAFAVLALVFATNGAARSGGVHPSGVTTVPKGFDLFHTDPEQNFFKFVGKSAIPAGFFAPDSQPFEGEVNFGGDPIITFQGMDVGNADTVVERTADGTPGPNGTAGDAVPIELRALSLVDVALCEPTPDPEKRRTEATFDERGCIHQGRHFEWSEPFDSRDDVCACFHGRARRF